MQKTRKTRTEAYIRGKKLSRNKTGRPRCTSYVRLQQNMYCQKQRLQRTYTKHDRHQNGNVSHTFRSVGRYLKPTVFRITNIHIFIISFNAYISLSHRTEGSFHHWLPAYARKCFERSICRNTANYKNSERTQRTFCNISGLKVSLQPRVERSCLRNVSGKAQRKSEPRVEKGSRLVSAGQFPEFKVHAPPAFTESSDR